MCGRFTLISGRSDLQLAFQRFVFPDELDLEARYNIPPTQPLVVVPNDTDLTAVTARWGLIPSWAKDVSIGSRMINARAETAADKPAFRQALLRRRCLIIADGFYEWKREAADRGKTPYYIQVDGGAPFAFAGLWDWWKSPDGIPLRSCTIITTTPNALMADIHNRMPVILPADAYGTWLSPDPIASADAADLLVPYPADRMSAYPVSRTVNAPRNDGPACIAPAGAGPPPDDADPQAPQATLF